MSIYSIKQLIAGLSFRIMGFDNFGQTILVKCALLGDAAVGKTAISQALGAFFYSRNIKNVLNNGCIF